MQFSLVNYPGTVQGGPAFHPMSPEQWALYLQV